MHGLSCSAACGIFPDQGSNPGPLLWQADSQPLRHQGSPGMIILDGAGRHVFLTGAISTSCQWAYWCEGFSLRPLPALHLRSKAQIFSALLNPTQCTFNLPCPQKSDPTNSPSANPFYRNQTKDSLALSFFLKLNYS